VLISRLESPQKLVIMLIVLTLLFISKVSSNLHLLISNLPANQLLQQEEEEGGTFPADTDTPDVGAAYHTGQGRAIGEDLKAHREVGGQAVKIKMDIKTIVLF